MRLCVASRTVNRWATGRDEMICTSAVRLRHWSRHALDLVLYWRDGPDHCLRMAALDAAERDWGWRDELEHIRREGL